MEVVATTPNGGVVPPFHNHDVHEWSRIDSLTGVLERARLETDQWTAFTNNSSHKYGKVVDSRAQSDADGVVQQRARKQLEVFQSNVPGGSLQVIKTHTVSSSKWTSKTSTGEHADIAQQFGDLELSLNPLDFKSQKSKAIVGRSVGRRPPSRLRDRDETSSATLTNVHNVAAVNQHRVSRLCHRIHENAVKQTFGKCLRKPSIHERESGDGIEIIEIESVNSSDNEKTNQVNERACLTRTKSTSSEDLNLVISENEKVNKNIESLEDSEQLHNWRRTSKIRRSLQFPKQNKSPVTAKPPDLPKNTGSVRKIREDLETGRRLNTALRGNSVDLEALDQILQTISNDSNKEEKVAKHNQSIKEVDVRKQKRNSFVTVESIQEVRGRLRRTNSHTSDIGVGKIKNGQNDLSLDNKREEEVDDGIVTEDNNLVSKGLEEMPVGDSLTAQTRMRSYVYGMEALIGKKSMLGTGSLECRAPKQLNGVSGYRSEDWYNRRKSYGFEQVHNHQEPTNTISKNKNLVDSSTDSGICRSNEIMLAPGSNKGSVQLSKSDDSNCDVENEKEFVINRKYENQNDSGILNIGNVKRYTSIFEQKKESNLTNNNLWNNKSEKLNKCSNFGGTTITIPISSQKVSNNINTQKFMFENQWITNYNQNSQNGDIKRHSIAVDESKYVTSRPTNDKFKRTSLAVNEQIPNSTDLFLHDGLDDDLAQGKKQKKVEFCKTEVHFAAESGKVNIVATDEKPPPTNNFRRRRRNSAALYNQFLSDINKTDLPILRFGDNSYDKDLFGVGVPNQEEDSLNDFNSDTFYDSKQGNELVSTNTVTVSTNQSYQNYQVDIEDDLKENLENEAPKGILKNKRMKPKPYLLGGDNFFQQNFDNEENGRKSPQSEIPMWRSTVTLKNTFFDGKQYPDYNSTENPNKSYNYEDTKREQEESNNSEYQRLIRNLRPVGKYQDQGDYQRNSENQDTLRNFPSPTDPRRSSWSVTDMIKQVENVRKTEARGFSTKVNIGGGEATVITDNLQEKGRHPTWPRHEDNSKGPSNLHLNQNTVHNELDKINNLQQPDNSVNEYTNSWKNQRKPVKSVNKNKSSPMVTRKSHESKKQEVLKSVYNGEKLSSPFLVGQNNLLKNEYEFNRSQKILDKSNSPPRKLEKPKEERIGKTFTKSTKTTQIDETTSSTFTKEQCQDYSPTRQKEKHFPSSVKHSPKEDKHYNSRQNEKHSSPSRHEDNLYSSATYVRQKSPNRVVLRNPRKSEMAYFGVKMTPSPKPTEKESHREGSWENKPDLLQHHDGKESVKYSKKVKVEATKHETVSRDKRQKERPESPIYENIEEVRKYATRTKTNKKEFDSSILDELTKAADQILEAVNSYAEDVQKQNAHEEKNKRTYRKEKLDTISETKSWKRESSSKTKSSSYKSEYAKPKLKHTSSTSSAESIAEHRKSLTPVRQTTRDVEKDKKKNNSDTSSSRAATKARRLQRASSREALLHSHGSSSEDLPVTVVVPSRKPRLVKKTKGTLLSVTSTTESRKSSSSTSRKVEDKGKSEERVSGRSLPEIRHKVAISTIPSTIDKSSSRNNAQKSRTEDSSKKSTSRREHSKLSSRSKCEKGRSVSNKDCHVSTASIKKCNKLEGSMK